MKAKKKHKRWWIIALSVVMGLVLLYGVGGLIASAAVCHAIFGKRASSLSDLDHFPSFYAKRADIASLEKREDISFVSGENTLTGHLYRTDTPKGLVLAAHGMSSQSDGEDAEYQAWFLEEGYDVLAIDLTASGASEGKESKGLWQSAYDVASAYQYIQTQDDLAVLPLTLVGHSWGGYGVLTSLSLGVQAEYVVSFAAFDMPRTLMKYDMGRYTNSFLEAIGSPMFDCYMDWMAPNGGKLSASEAISSSKAKVFCVQGGKDVAVPPDSLSVYGNKDRITNPNFTTYFSPNAGHHGVWRSDASRHYVETVVDPAYQAYQAKHPDGGSKEEQAAFRSCIDLTRSSELDASLFAALREFLSN